MKRLLPATRTGKRFFPAALPGLAMSLGPALGMILGMIFGLGLSPCALAADGTAVPSVRALAVPSDARLPEALGPEVRPLGAGVEAFGRAPEGPSEEGGSGRTTSLSAHAPGTERNEPALRLHYLGTLGLPETSLERIARDLAKLGLPYTIRGLPWKTVKTDPNRKDIARRETTLEDLTEPFNRWRTPVYVDPRPFRALEKALRREGFSGELPLPLWLVTLSGDAPATEVLPGDLSPLCALGELLARTESPVLREKLRADVRERLAERFAASSEDADAAWDEVLVCADFAPDVRPDLWPDLRPDVRPEP